MAPPPAGRRPGRLLVGWLDEDRARRLAASGLDRPDALAATVARARAFVAARPASTAEAARSAAPPGMAARAGLEGDDVEVALVALGDLRAMQPYVFVDPRSDLPGDTTSIDCLADTTLGPGERAAVDVRFDEATGALEVRSASQNLSVLGRFAGPLPEAPAGAEGVGFLVGLAPSRVRVALLGGHAVLVDGYHRAVALLAAGVEVAPALVTEESTVDEVFPTGMLAPDVVLGRRPPRVSDYLDDVVSLAVDLPYAGHALRVRVEALDRALEG